MKNVYMIKELCPMWNDGSGVSYKDIKPYIFIIEEEVEECRLDYEYISGEKALCTEYELIKIEINDNVDMNELIELEVEGKMIKNIKIINGDYEQEHRYDIHRYEWLKDAGRISDIDDGEDYEEEYCCDDMWKYDM